MEQNLKLDIIENLMNQNLKIEIVENVEFDAIMSYDDWKIFKYKDKYYVADDDIRQVILVSKCKPEEYNSDDKDVVDFGNDYCGESDDSQWYLGFDLVS